MVLEEGAVMTWIWLQTDEVVVSLYRIQLHLDYTHGHLIYIEPNGFEICMDVPRGTHVFLTRLVEVDDLLHHTQLNSCLRNHYIDISAIIFHEDVRFTYSL